MRLLYLFSPDRKPIKGLLLLEWATLAYIVFTLVVMILTYTRLHSQPEMLMLRFQTVAITLALWGVYRLIPCRLTLLARVAAQMMLLGSWYPETYEFNRILPNLDHVFATWEQQLFGFQPALLFYERMGHPVVSELLTLGYESYYPLMAAVPLYYLFCREKEFLKASFVVLTSFFVFYVVFIFLPVAGPQYYYLAVGMDKIAQGHFPNVGLYFETHSECLPIPGWKDGPMYHTLLVGHAAGERPTAAFPSSHVGVTTVLLWLAWHARSRWLFWSMMPFAVLMFFATFYIRAHYAIDALAGIVAGTMIYFMLMAVHRALSRYAP